MPTRWNNSGFVSGNSITCEETDKQNETLHFKIDQQSQEANGTLARLFSRYLHSYLSTQHILYEKQLCKKMAD